MRRRAVIARIRLDLDDGADVDRLAVIAPLKPGSAGAARELAERGPPFELEDHGLAGHAIYVSSAEVVFVFEGAGVESIVGDLVNDPAISAAFSAWGPLLDGTPRLARPAYRWARDNAPTRAATQ